MDALGEYRFARQLFHHTPRLRQLQLARGEMTAAEHGSDDDTRIQVLRSAHMPEKTSVFAVENKEL